LRGGNKLTAWRLGLEKGRKRNTAAAAAAEEGSVARVVVLPR